MLTYTLKKTPGHPLYEQLYQSIRDDIAAGRLPAGSRLPSKRVLAAHLGVSVVTVESAYAQLLAEGYAEARPRSGVYVCAIGSSAPVQPPHMPSLPQPTAPEPLFDLSGGTGEDVPFPASVWVRTMREVIADKRLMQPVDFAGAPELRAAIAAHLEQARGLRVSPEQIFIGAGTEYFYALLAQFLGRGQRFAIEDPCHRTLAQVYSRSGAEVVPVPMDESGIRVAELEESGAQIVHVSPSHQYPTGTVMPITRRQALLAWMGCGEERFLIEDDYDSEFRFSGLPIPTLQSLDTRGRVIYLNTFSKTIAPALRISYMILPQALLARWRSTMGFYSCAVPSFEQLTLTRFLDGGYFERHVSRMKKHYKARLQGLLALLAQPETARLCTARQAVAGLHFLLEFHTEARGQSLRAALGDAGLSAPLLSEFYLRKSPAEAERCAVVQYSGLTEADFAESLQKLSQRLTPEA